MSRPTSSTPQGGPGADLRERVSKLVGEEPGPWTQTPGGYSPAERWRVEFPDGRSVFVKAATTERTADALRKEIYIYQTVGADFMPRLLGWDDDTAFPVLVLEDLSEAHWPPPWSPDHVGRVVDLLAGMHATDPPGELDTLESQRDELMGWSKIAADPGPFLGLRLASANWLEDALPILRRAEQSAVLGGDDFLHFDVRSDNLCFAGDRTILVDWNWACRGNGKLDLAFWLPSLHAEGGPRPDSLLRGGDELSAIVSGYFAARAGLPAVDFAPGVREIQLRQLHFALPWAVRVLGLSPLDGVQGS